MSQDREIPVRFWRRRHRIVLIYHRHHRQIDLKWDHESHHRFLPLQHLQRTPCHQPQARIRMATRSFVTTPIGVNIVWKLENSYLKTSQPTSAHTSSSRLDGSRRESWAHSKAMTRQKTAKSDSTSEWLASKNQIQAWRWAKFIFNDVTCWKYFSDSSCHRRLVIWHAKVQGNVKVSICSTDIHLLGHSILASTWIW